MRLLHVWNKKTARSWSPPKNHKSRLVPIKECTPNTHILYQVKKRLLTLVWLLWLVGFGQQFIQGEGTWFYKSCHYKCGRYERAVVYRVDPSFICPTELKHDCSIDRIVSGQHGCVTASSARVGGQGHQPNVDKVCRCLGRSKQS